MRDCSRAMSKFKGKGWKYWRDVAHLSVVAQSKNTPSSNSFCQHGTRVLGAMSWLDGRACARFGSGAFLQQRYSDGMQSILDSMQVRRYGGGQTGEQTLKEGFQLSQAGVEIRADLREEAGTGKGLGDAGRGSSSLVVRNPRIRGRSFARKRGWPWISVIPSESTEHFTEMRPKRSVTAAFEHWDTRFDIKDSSSVEHLTKTGLPEARATFAPLNLFPVRIPDRIESILSKYRWTGQTLVELRALTAEVRTIPCQHILTVLKKQRDAELSLNFLRWAMDEANCTLHIKCFTIVIALLGRVRKFSLLEKLLDELDDRGYILDKIIFTAAIRWYGEAQKMQEALELLERMKSMGFMPDCVTYSVLIQMFSKAKLYQEALKVYEEMLALGIATDTQLYNCVICTLGKAGRLDIAYQKLEEMREQGHIPDHFTYGVLLEGYSKAGRSEFMTLYKEMQDLGIPLNEIIFNIMLFGVDRIGKLEDAEIIFSDMERLGMSSNLNAFATLIGMCSKIGKAEVAQQWFDKMLKMGLEPTLAISNSLLNSYVQGKFFGKAKQVLDSFHKWNIAPNLQTYTVVLRSLALCEKLEDIELVKGMLSCYGGSEFLSIVVDTGDEHNYSIRVTSFLSGLRNEKRQFKRDFVDALINYLYRIGCQNQAHFVWEEALGNYLFPKMIEQGSEGICSVNLQNMEVGTAIVALTRTLPRLIKQFNRKEMTPEWVQIIIGSIWDQSALSDSKSVQLAMTKLLQTLHSPFRIDNLQTGVGFVGRGAEVMQWLEESQIKALLASKR